MGVANARNASLERARHRLQLELGDTLCDLGKARSSAAVLGRKQQHFDRCLDDWRQQQEESQAMLEASRREARALSAELLELRQAYEESSASRETLQTANKQLQGTRSRAWSQSRSKEVQGEAPAARARLSAVGRHLSMVLAPLGSQLFHF